MPTTALPPDTERTLVVVPPTSLVTAEPGGLVQTTHGSALAKRSARHPKTCRCVRCRKRRAHRRATNTSGMYQQAYVEATIISITPDEEGQSTWQGYSGHMQGTHASRPTRHGRRGQRYRFLVTAALFSLLLLALLAFSGIGGRFVGALVPPSATITIIAKGVQESRAITVTAVTGRPGANQVTARLISASASLTAMARSSGSGQTAALASHGTLTFYNEGGSPLTVAAGTIIRGADGIEVVTETTVTVPAGNPPSVGTAAAAAHSVQAGSQSNIGALDVSGLCCAAGIAVKNTSAFSGAQDAQSYPLLVQRDIDDAAGSVQQELANRTGRLLRQQLSSSQQLAIPPLCRTVVKPADGAGSRVTQTSVVVTVTCTGEAFDATGARIAAATIFTREISGQLAPHYKLISSISTGTPQPGVADTRRGTLALLVQARATWGYQFTGDEKQGLARLIGGKSVANALTFIAGAPGVEHCSIQISGNVQTLPTDASQVTIVVLPARGGP